MEKGRKTSKGFIIYQIVAFAFLCTTIIWNVTAASKSADQTVHMDKASIFEIVRNNASTILADIDADDFTRTMLLLASSPETPEITRTDDGVFFYCYGWGWASNTGYEGFYYVPWDGPAEIGGIMSPFPFSVQGPELIEHLEPEGEGWVWYEKQTTPGGDNVYYTEKICDCFWYYCLEY
ncbi:MAG: hypothetical protein K6A68_13350 [Clostridiales bacterium]|nr:hypothetical protein [Clostridiales bacterium]